MFFDLLFSLSLFQELKDTLYEELDFEHEGLNQERCARELKHLSYVCVPKIHWEHTSKVRPEREREYKSNRLSLVVACINVRMD